ncbi:MAG TPA: glutathione S-transferase family protein [Dongiaceae bacterium]|nr:glutathione S-transferase family protein [Dongiaceae bacterium]
MGRLALFGATYSVYVRIVRLVLEEAGTPYDLIEIDIFDRDKVPPDYAERHPFNRIPALEHDGFRLFETDAIVAYLLDRFGAHELMPDEVQARARMRQLMRVADNYAYRALVWGIYIEEMERGRLGLLTSDELARAGKCLRVLADLSTPDFLVGQRLTLADLWLQPMLAYLDLAPAGRALLREVPELAAWLARMRQRRAVVATRFPAEQRGA